jgi:hypothetical protein
VSCALATFLPPFGVEAQGLSDLVGKKTSGGGQTTGDSLDLRFGRDRADLGLSPNLRPILSPERKTVGISAQADLRMICGQYDLKASVQNMLGREAREEFLEGILGSLVQELVGSGMELLCQAEPTLCTLLQNHSISANMKVGYYKDLCQAVESAVAQAQKQNYATAVDQCLKEKKDQGMSLDRAVELCQKKSPQVTGFRGEVLGELDLGKELHGLFETMGLSPGAQKLAKGLSDDTKLGPGSQAAQLDPSAVPRLFDESQADYAKKLGAVLDQASSQQPIAAADLVQLVPPGAPPIAEDEVRDYARLSPRDRAASVSSIASALAIYEMGQNISELERALEVLKSAPTVDEAKRKMLEDRMARLRNEKSRLAERLRDQSLVMQAMGATKALAAQEYSRRVASIEERVGEQGRNRQMLQDTRSYGTLPSKSAGQTSQGGAELGSPGSGDCLNCGFNFSFGSYGSQK